MGLEVQDVNTLGDIINSTFGRTSTPRSTNTLSITCKILNENTLLITFTTIMTFYNNSQMQAQKNKMNDDELIYGYIEDCADMAIQRILKNEEVIQKQREVLKAKTGFDQTPLERFVDEYVGEVGPMVGLGLLGS